MLSSSNVELQLTKKENIVNSDNNVIPQNIINVFYIVTLIMWRTTVPPGRRLFIV